MTPDWVRVSHKTRGRARSVYLLVELYALDERLRSRDPAEAEAARDNLAERVHANYAAINIHGEERAQGLEIAYEHRNTPDIHGIVECIVSAPRW